jgi:neural Wiskott-Aldrich syndrome protein
MKIQCFADDPREPDLIGETMVDLTEVLTKGETDGKCLMNKSLSLLTRLRTEWFTLMNKDKYCGEVYLELTFWSNVRPVPYYIIFLYINYS